MVWPATRLVNAAPLSMIAMSLDMIAAALHPIASPPPSSGTGETRWQWPLRPRPPVVRRFDPPIHPWEAGHRGVDLAAPPGRPVFAAGAGRVAFARDLAGRGVVTITHGPVRTTYLPVRPIVRAGQTVAAGARIGVVEAVLGHCGQESCLHWGLLRGDAYLDPLSLLGLGPVRLLPWWNAPAPSVAEPGDERRSPLEIGLAGPPAGPPPTRPAGTPAPTLQADARSDGKRSDGGPPASPPVDASPVTRPVGATTGIGAAIGPIAVAGAAALTMSRALARGRRRRSRHRRDPGRRRRGRK